MVNVIGLENMPTSRIPATPSTITTSKCSFTIDIEGQL